MKELESSQQVALAGPSRGDFTLLLMTYFVVLNQAHLTLAS